MGFANGIITAPVSVADVQNALGMGSSDVGTLCKSDRVNPWAKYKPIEFKLPNNVLYPGILTDAQRQSKNWGMANIPIWTGKTIANVVDFWLGSGSSGAAPDCGTQPAYWTNLTPTSFARLADFAASTSAGYYVGASAPIVGVDSVDKSGSVVTILFGMNLSGIYSGLALWYGNFDVMTNVSFKNLYFGALMKVGNQYFLATQDNTVGDLGTSSATLWSMGAHVRFKIGTTSGNLVNYVDNYTPFEVFPVMSSVKNYVESTVITPISANTSGNFVAIHEKDEIIVPGTITVRGDILFFYAWKDADHNRRINYSIRVVANDPGSHYFNVTLTALNSLGEQVGNTNTVLNAASPYEAATYIDLGSATTTGVKFLRVDVTKGSSDTSTIFVPTQQTVDVNDEISPYV